MRKRSAVWLVPNTMRHHSSQLASQGLQSIGSLALNNDAAFAPDTRAAQAPACILIVEGDPHIANLLRRALKLGADVDWAVEVATDGHLTLLRPRSTAPAIALIDTVNLSLDGVEVYHRLRALPQAQASNIVFITSSTALELSARGVEAGFLLRKPFKVAHAISLITALVSER
jgi:DNA-binding response OmpR family regulator